MLISVANRAHARLEPDRSQ